MRTFLIRACKLGMCDGDFLFIYTFIYNPNVEAWKKDDEDDEIAKKAYRHLIHVRIKIYNSQRSPVYIGLNSCTSPIIIKLVLRNLKYRRWHINTAYFDWLIKIARGGGQRCRCLDVRFTTRGLTIPNSTILLSLYTFTCYWVAISTVLKQKKPFTIIGHNRCELCVIPTFTVWASSHLVRCFLLPLMCLFVVTPVKPSFVLHLYTKPILITL